MYIESRLRLSVQFLVAALGEKTAFDIGIAVEQKVL